MIAKVKSIDVDEVKEEFEVKLYNIKDELEDLDKEKVLKIAKKKSEDIKRKCQELVDLAIEKGTPVLKDAAIDVRDKTIDVMQDIIKKLENLEANTKKLDNKA